MIKGNTVVFGSLFIISDSDFSKKIRESDKGAGHDAGQN